MSDQNNDETTKLIPEHQRGFGGALVVVQK